MATCSKLLASVVALVPADTAVEVALEHANVRQTSQALAIGTSHAVLVIQLATVGSTLRGVALLATLGAWVGRSRHGSRESGR